MDSEKSEAKARKKEYDKEYRKRPEVKARISELRKERYYEKLQNFKPSSFRDLRKYQKNVIVTFPNEMKQTESLTYTF